MITCKDKDGTDYLYIREMLKKAFDKKRKEMGLSKDNMISELAGETGIPYGTIFGHLRNEGTKGATNPSIDAIKQYGRILTGDEYAFLVRPYTKELSNEDQSESCRSDAVHIVFEMLYDILSCYESSDCFNYIPGTDDSNGAWSFFEHEVDRVRKKLETEFLGRRDSTDFQKLERIINETEVFIKSYSIPGVVKRWIEINPQINFFDCGFEIIEECGKETASQLYRKGVLDYLPCAYIIDARKNYFGEKALVNEKDNLKYSEERIFQNELLRTLVMVFGNDFKDNHTEKRVT